VLDALTADCAEPVDVAVLEDGLCRREWAAAIRWFATLNIDSAQRRGDLAYARAIERGELTPWADQPDTPGQTVSSPAGWGKP
jgi:hypothetical protein